MLKTFLRVTAGGLAMALLLGQQQPAAAQDAPGKTLTLPEPTGTPPATCTPVQGAAIPTRDVVLQQSFLDNFKTLDKAALGRPYQTATTWMAHFAGDPSQVNFRTLPANNEQEIYVDPSYAGTTPAPLRLDPFTLTPDGLVITATRTPAQLKAALSNFPFYSGMLQSKKLFSQTYGYFEAKAKMPTGKAMWPAFWMLNVNGAWPPEIDIFEMFDGTKPDKQTMTVHFKTGGYGPHQATYCNISVPGAETAFHLYGVLWNMERITFYVDRSPVATFATPPGLNTPMYMLLDLAVENHIDATTPDTAQFGVGWVTAYKY
ncbi:MAG TPA: glycoside hydrolase family 16 protein [Candidatus Sulfotelmatobacter sp.]|nr:glycoside hydrolase family 16 protein [Candidatus Sulfotelmatobacter sp.]